MLENITEEDLMQLLPGCYYMDPPDGGSVTILEQLQRMAQDAARYRDIKSEMLVVQKRGHDAEFVLGIPRPITDIMNGDPRRGLDVAIDDRIRRTSCKNAPSA